MTDAIADHGYEATTVAQVIAYAGVSRATFYEHFADKDACALAAYQDTVTYFTRRFRRAATPAADPTALRPALSALLSSVAANPARGLLVFSASRAAGRAFPDHPPALLTELRRLTAPARSHSTRPVLDISPVALLGALTTVISNRLAADASDRLPLLVDDLAAWSDTYLLPPGIAPSSRSTRAVLGQPPPIDPALLNLAAARKPDLLPKGRRKLPDGVIARNQRSRLIHAVAEAALPNGYRATTVAEIAATANVGRQIFYEHFTDRQQAALHAQRHILRFALSGVGRAYFTGTDWPARVRNALLYITTLIAEQPALAHLVIVETDSIAASAPQNLRDALTSLAVILEEGYHQSNDTQQLPRLYSEASIGAVFELIRHQLLCGDGPQLPKHLPQLTYIATAPFLGARQAAHLAADLADSN